MVTFPARIIIDKKIFYKKDNYMTKNNSKNHIYHNKYYSKSLTANYIEKYNIKFNLYDMEQKIYLMKEKNLGEIKLYLFTRFPSPEKIRLETIANSKLVADYDFNNIWGNEIW